MKFLQSDWDWSDIHTGLTQERQKRLQKLRAEIIKQASGIAEPHGFSVDVPEGIFSVGVQGDDSTYTLVVFLKGKIVDWDVVEKISNQITNTMPVNRVTVEI